MNIVSQAAPPNPASRSNVVAVLVDVRDHLDEVDLDTIDGEFYWRCCRPDLIRAVDSLRDRIRGLRDRDRSAGDASGAQTVRDYEALRARYQSDFPNVLNYLVGGGRIAMRDAYTMRMGVRAHDPFRRQPFLVGHETLVELRVFSGAWTGDDVETRLRGYLLGPWISKEERDRFEPEPTRPPNAVAVRIALALIDPEEASDAFPRWGDIAFAPPHVVVSVGLPLPPEGEVARMYDTIVRGDKQWHLRLGRGATRQEKRVAIRTWVAGLLVGSGRKTAIAISEACDALNEEPVSSVQFSQDRVRLLARVPEASTYIRVKPARGVASRR